MYDLMKNENYFVTLGNSTRGLNRANSNREDSIRAEDFQIIDRALRGDVVNRRTLKSPRL